MKTRRTLAAMVGLAMLPALALTGPAVAAEHDVRAGATNPVLPTQPVEQFRGYWVDAFNAGVYTADQVTTLVADAVDLGANALVVQTGRRFDCFCNDALYPRTDAAVDPAPYDPLAEVIRQAHVAGIEVHAWVNATTLWNSATPPRSPEHAFNAHGLAAAGTDRWLNRRVDGAEQVGTNSFVDPANPAAVDYVVEAISSIATNYDIDGINLDYIRYPDYNAGEFQNDWGYSETSLARFAAETGRTDRPKPTDAEFSDWRRDQVSALVRKTYVALYEADPSDRLSVNGTTYAYGPVSYGGWEGARPFTNVLQDWKGWLDEGTVDTVTAMNYKREWVPEQARMFDEWNSALAEYRAGRHVVSGPALYLNEIPEAVQQARDVVAAGLNGWLGYSYANASMTATASGDQAVKRSERTALAAALRAELFAAPAVVPEMGWKATPTAGLVAGAVVVRDGAVADQVEVLIQPIARTPGERKVVRTDGSGWFGAVDLAPGRYRVRVVEPGAEGAATRIVQVKAGAITHVSLRVGSV